MRIVYFGKKRPKVVMIEREQGSEPVKLSFDPFKAIDVPDDIAAQLLENAPDIFKREDSRKPVSEIKASGNGYVGDVHAAHIPDLEKQIKADQRAEEGKDVDAVISEAAKKKEEDVEVNGDPVKKSGKKGKRIIAQ